MYIPQIYQLKDAAGNTQNVAVHKSALDGDGYTAEIAAGTYVRMASGRERQPIVATGIADSPLEAARCAIDNYNVRKKTTP